MKILTKKKQKQVVHDLITIYQIGSDAMKAVGIRRQEAFSIEEAIRLQDIMTNAAFRIVDTIQGVYGVNLFVSIEEEKYKREEKYGWPLKRK